MIDVYEFANLLEQELDDVDKNTLKPDLSYRSIPNFSSMHALIIIAFIDSEFDVLLTGQELRGAETVQDLYELVCSKIKQ